MMSLGQKMIAIAMVLFIEVLAFAFVPLLGFLGLFFAIPLTIVILKR